MQINGTVKEKYAHQISPPGTLQGTATSPTEPSRQFHNSAATGKSKSPHPIPVYLLSSEISIVFS